MKPHARRPRSAQARRARRPAAADRRARSASAARPGDRGGSWIGRDLGRARPRGGSRLRGRPLAALLLAGLLCALGLAALRIDILRARYALAEAIHEEKSLQEAQRRHLARVETLRDPARLAALARKRGFERPERVLELRDPADGARP